MDVKGREDAVDVKGLEDDATETIHGCVDGVDVESAGKRDEVGDTVSLWSLCGGLLGVAVGHGASIGCRQGMK